MNVVSRLFQAVKRDGLSYFTLRMLARLLNQPSDIQRVKDKVWAMLRQKHQMRVAYGPFKGMKLNDNVWWSNNDRITQTLGIYEEPVMNRLIDISKSGASQFIDIGAADGYFCVGMAYGNFYETVIAYELVAEGQDRIRENARNNGCAEKVSVRGEASLASLGKVLTKDKKTALLIDIEGAEYGFLNDQMLDLLQDHYVICELHPWLAENGYEEEKSLLSRASQRFTVEVIQRESYNPNCFAELADLSDEERLIAVGEGRGKNMNWLILSPK